MVAARIMQYWRIDADTGDANDILNRSLSRSHSPWPRTQEWIENMLLLKVRDVKPQPMVQDYRGEDGKPYDVCASEFRCLHRTFSGHPKMTARMMNKLSRRRLALSSRT